jgi:hypothetical protein
MMAWRALSPRTIVAAAEAAARRKSTGGAAPAADTRDAGSALGAQKGGASAVSGTPVNDVAVTPRSRLAD